MSRIKKIKAREILDSRGKPTVEVELFTDFGKFLASSPSGISKGKHEAIELKAKKAVKNINQIIASALYGKSPTNQKIIDKFLIKLDGTKNKKKLGANAVLAVSIAALRAGAREKELSLWKYISQIANTKPKLPKPCILLVEGGMHGKNKLDIQEFMVIPEGRSFGERFSKGKKIYQKLKKILKNKFGQKGVATGLEGAFAPKISEPRAVLDFVLEAAFGYNIKIGLDCAVSHLKKVKYNIDFYQKLARDYPVLFLEDPFGQDDWEGWRELNSKFLVRGSRLLIVGDDLTTTNPERIKQAYKKKACNGVIIKPNQIGTVTEAIEAAKLAKSFGWKLIVSHRSGETKDDFIADFAVGIGADFIKAGAPFPKERMAKYKRLLKIEKEL